MIICAIDPGKRGAVIIINTMSNKAYFELLSYNKHGILTNNLNRYYEKIDILLVEKIRGRGGWGASSVFQMGFYFGQLIYELKDFHIQYIQPTVWTRHIHKDVEKIKGRNTSKEKSLRAYNKKYPHNPVKKYHDGVIDALLIATFFFETQGIKIKKFELKEKVNWL